MTTIRLEGVPEALDTIDGLRDISDILRPPLKRALLRLQRKMAVYPPPPPNSSYRRTGTLGRRWTTATSEITRQRRAEIEGRVGNNTEYGPFVQSAQFQADIHRNRWRTAEDVAESEERWIQGEFENALQSRADE